jgi:hypothetical protein
MTRVGVLWRAKSLRALRSVGDQGLPLFRVDLLMAPEYAAGRTERMFDSRRDAARSGATDAL